MNKSSIGIIGGGIMGIDIARRLSKEKYEVSLIEGASDLGGLASAWKFGDYKWDKFYHVILPDDTNTLEMIIELGLENELIWVKTKTGFFINGKYHSVSNIMEFLKFPTLNLIDKFRLGLTIIMGSYLSNYERLEKIPVSIWLKRWSGRNTFNKIWLPLLKAKLGEGYKDSSAVFICSTIKRLYKARKEGSKKEVFGYVKGGYARILDKLKSKLISENIELITNFKVKEIVKKSGTKLKVTSNEGSEKTFDYVISTLPSYLSASVCPELSDSESERLKSIKYLGVLCVTLLLKKPLTPYYVTNITDNGIPFTGIVELTSLVDPSFFGGNTLIYLPKYLKSDDQSFYLSDQILKDRFIGSLKLMHPSLKDDDIVCSQVARAKYVITLPEIDYSKRLPSYKTSLRNLFIINSSFITDGTLNVNESLKISKTYLPRVIKIIENEE